MKEGIFFNSYKLKEGISVSEFLMAVEEVKNQYISKQKGFISFKLIVDGDRWADLTTFESLDDAKQFGEKNKKDGSGINKYSLTFYSYINILTCRSQYFTIVRSWIEK